MKLINFCNRVVEYSFYSLFLLVPLVFASNTSELFEFNKMWLTFILTIFIAGAWFTKVILEKKISIQRTPLDIPILLFLLSQIISSIFTLDGHISWWGYYSRFNGGLLSTITYIFLYYAFVSNLEVKHVLKTLKITLLSAVIVALWGLPSHFGYDPTCLVFRGTLDTSCWTDAFKPTVRIFSTLGQPAWLAAYLATLIPLIAAYAIKNPKFEFTNWKFIVYMAIAILFYFDLIFTDTRAGFLAFWIANVIFWIILFIKKFFTRKVFLRVFLTFNAILLICTFTVHNPINAINKFTLPGIKENLAQKKVSQIPAASNSASENSLIQPKPVGGTDSGDIRKYVWQGAIDAWKANPIFGTGVETFAFAYYKFRPAGHNLTSEWDYLYNKAHNEYLNYLTTTGLFGLGSYLLFIGLFTFLTTKPLLSSSTKEPRVWEAQLLTIGLFTGWLSILVTNFFGFSVVIMNLFLFLIPAFVFILNEALPNKKIELQTTNYKLQTNINPYQWTIIIILLFTLCALLFSLIRYWQADIKYALGTNLDRVGSYKEAYPLLTAANEMKPNEPVYADELSINIAVLATAFAGQNDATNSSSLASAAIGLNNKVVAQSPNNIVYWKNRVRLFYTLAQIDPSQQPTYYNEALKSIEKAHDLAPTDAKISYNLGVLYGQTGDIQKGIEVLQQTIKLKPDYRDPYFALGLFYHQLAVDQNNRVVNIEMQQKAIETYQYILKNISSSDEEVKKSLEEWGAL